MLHSLSNRRNNLLFILVLWLFSTVLIAQTNKDFKKLFVKAESFFLYEEDYPLAVPLYLKLLEQDPDNANINYKIGVCYLGIPGKKKEAIPYLEEAVKNTTIDFKDDDYKERKAPLVALFYLGHAYQINNRIDDAIAEYSKFKASSNVEEFYEVEYVDLQIEACKRAVIRQDNSLDVKSSSLSELMNPNSNNFSPVVSGNGSVLVYTSDDNGYKRIYISKRENGNWTKPVDISIDLNCKGDCSSSSLSYDGKTLLLYKSDNKIGNIYISYFSNDHWTEIEKLKKINSKYWESNACISPDGKTIYVASNRKGGFGGLDIYKSESIDKNEWGPLENLGPGINSAFHENYPQIINDGKTLYFSSQGHATMGGFDIFYAEKINGSKWAEPLNIGYPVNTTDDNIYYMPIGNGDEAYYARYPDHEAGKLMIYHYAILAGLPISNVKITGRLSLDDNLLMHADSSYAIVIMDSSFTNVIDTIYPLAEDGEFEFEIPTGTFKLEFIAEGYEPLNKIVTIHENTNLNEIELKPKLIPTEVANGKYIVIRNIYFGFNSYQLSRDSKLELEKLLDILRQFPTLKVEFEGHTDSKGPSDYNLKLSKKRAESVKEYLIEHGVNSSQLITKAYGESEHIAINHKADGSDSPEGRSLNRRVTIKVLNAGDEIKIKMEIFVPEHLRLGGNVEYKILVLFSKELLDSNYFDNYNLASLENIQTKKISNGFLYLTQTYNNYVEVANQFGRILEAGFSTATLHTSQDLDDMISQESLELTVNKDSIPFYTIQIASSKLLLDSKYFTNISNLRVSLSKNNYYRYTTGEYKGYSNAQKALEAFKKTYGFKQAFIKEFNKLNR